MITYPDIAICTGDLTVDIHTQSELTDVGESLINGDSLEGKNVQIKMDLSDLQISSPAIQQFVSALLAGGAYGVQFLER